MGSQSVSWDGKDNNGDEVIDGLYYFEVEARDVDGNLISTNTYGIDRVYGLKFVQGNAILKLSDRDIYLSDIYEILDPSQI